MSENLTGLVKIIGITVLLFILWGVLATQVPDKFLTTNNIENLLRRTALYGVLGIGVAFVIISSGIDLSIGSLVCLCGVLFAMFVEVNYAPQNQVPIVQLSIGGTSTVLVEDSPFDEGDDVWLYVDRKTKNLMTISAVSQKTVDGKSYDELKLEGRLRGASPEGIAEIGFLTRAYEVANLREDRFEWNSEVKLRKRDKVRFVHPTKPAKERGVIESNGQEIRLESPVSGIDGYRVVPIRRKPRMSVPIALGLVLLIALGLGLIHGLLITKWNQQPFIITLCGLLIYRGLARRLANDQPLGFIEYTDSLGLIANGRWVVWSDGASSFGIPYSFFILIALTIVAVILLNFTVWGRYLMALGRNEEAARYSGINTGWVTIGAYVLCAVLTAVGGMMFAIDANSVPPASFGNFFELYAIAAAVLGGCSLRGGEGSIIGVVVGTALMQTLYNSIVLLGIPDTLEFTIIGAVILIGVVSDELVRKLASRLRRS